MKRVSFVVLFCLACLPVRAENLRGKLGLGGVAGGALPFGSAWVDDNNSHSFYPGAWLRYHVTDRWGLGLGYDHVGFKGNARTTVESVGLNAYYMLTTECPMNPNVHAGLAQTSLTHNEGGNNYGVATKLGLGIDHLIQDKVSVGATLDYLHAFKTQAMSHPVETFLYGVTVGLWFQAGAGEEEPRAPAAPAPVDSDKDGVVDALDRCPNTPAGTPVNSMGCPRGEKVSIQLLIEFDTDKWDVKTEYDQQLLKVSEFMKAYPDTKAEIEGHTDSVGEADYNLQLSQKRADAVRQALIDRFGVPADRLEARGYGETKPVDTNDTPEGRAKNRRVMATFSALKD